MNWAAEMPIISTRVRRCRISLPPPPPPATTQTPPSNSRRRRPTPLPSSSLVCSREITASTHGKFLSSRGTRDETWSLICDRGEQRVRLTLSLSSILQAYRSRRLRFVRSARDRWKNLIVRFEVNAIAFPSSRVSIRLRTRSQ